MPSETQSYENPSVVSLLRITKFFNVEVPAEPGSQVPENVRTALGFLPKVVELLDISEDAKTEIIDRSDALVAWLNGEQTRIAGDMVGMTREEFDQWRALGSAELIGKPATFMAMIEATAL